MATRADLQDDVVASVFQNQFDVTVEMQKNDTWKRVTTAEQQDVFLLGLSPPADFDGTQVSINKYFYVTIHMNVLCFKIEVLKTITVDVGRLNLKTKYAYILSDKHERYIIYKIVFS